MVTPQMLERLPSNATVRYMFARWALALRCSAPVQAQQQKRSTTGALCFPYSPRNLHPAHWPTA
eukprot:1159823-Pelagomonas_calceolata.AAC.7